MVFKKKTDETKFVKISDQYLEKVWKDGKEKSRLRTAVGLSYQHLR